MELLATLNHVRAAQGFCDYLNSIGITCQAEPVSSEQLALYVKQEQIDLAREELQEFIENPHQDKYLEASWQTGNTRNNLVYSGEPLNLTSRFIKLSPLIQIVSVLSCGIYLGFILGAFSSLFEIFQFKVGQPYTWLTPAFMHFSAVHLIFNLMWWMYLGDKVHKELGAFHLSLVFLITALASNWAQYLLVDANFGGLSGVVYGLLGFCWVFGHINKESTLSMRPSIVGFMLVWLAIGFADVLFINMANWAHLAGLLSGMGMAVLYGKQKEQA